MLKKFMVGNWKMNKTRSEAASFFKEFDAFCDKSPNVTRTVDAGFCVSSTLFDICMERSLATNTKIFAQNVHYALNGAFTGEISCEMLKDVGITGSIIGHSERRQYFGDTDETVGKKWDALAKSAIFPIVCVGETLEERKNNDTHGVIKRQVFEAAKFLTDESKKKSFAIAYEPVWAIGTGVTASPEQADEIHNLIRGLLKELFGIDQGQNTAILYGGSMNDANCLELLRKPNIDGGLIGGASLKATSFFNMLKIAASI